MRISRQSACIAFLAFISSAASAQKTRGGSDIMATCKPQITALIADGRAAGDFKGSDSEIIAQFGAMADQLVQSPAAAAQSMVQNAKSESAGHLSMQRMYECMGQRRLDQVSRSAEAVPSDQLSESQIVAKIRRECKPQIDALEITVAYNESASRGNGDEGFSTSAESWATARKASREITSTKETPPEGADAMDSGIGPCIRLIRLGKPPAASRSDEQILQIRSTCRPQFEKAVAWYTIFFVEQNRVDHVSTDNRARASDMVDAFLRGTLGEDETQAPSVDALDKCAKRAPKVAVTSTPAGGLVSSEPNSPQRAQECLSLARKQNLSGSAASEFASDCKALGKPSKTIGPTQPAPRINDRTLVAGSCITAKFTKGTSIVNRDKTTFENKCSKEVEVYYCTRTICRTTAEFNRETLGARETSSVGGSISRFAACAVGARFELARTLLGEGKFNCVSAETDELAKGLSKAPVITSAGCVTATYRAPNSIAPSGETYFQNTCNRDVVVWWCKDAACRNDELIYHNIPAMLGKVSRGAVPNWSTCIGDARVELLPPNMDRTGLVFRCINTFHVGSPHTGDFTSGNKSSGSSAAGTGSSSHSSASTGAGEGHNPALVAMNCMQIVTEPPDKYSGKIGWHWRNNCTKSVRVFWCMNEKADGKCGKGGYMATYKAGEEEKYGRIGDLTQWGACYADNMWKVGFIEGTNSTKFRCVASPGK